MRDDWHTTNQQQLMSALTRVRAYLESHTQTPRAEPRARPIQGLETDSVEPPRSSALDSICAAFGLSPFERDLLLLCAGIELDSTFASLCAAAQGDPQKTFPTFSLALAAIPEAHWSAITPTAPLRRWRLIEIHAGAALTTSPLRIDERVLHYLTGLSHLDERLVGWVEPAPNATNLVPSHRALVEQITRAWSSERAPVIQLCGEDREGKKTIATAASAALGLRLWILNALVLPTDPRESENLQRLWEREAVLSGGALFLDCEEADASEAPRGRAVAHFIEHTRSPLIVATRERRRSEMRVWLTLDVLKPTAKEQHALWQSLAPNLNGRADALVAQFNLHAHAIRAAAAEAIAQASDHWDDAIWDAARAQARPRLDDLAPRIESIATWDDLVLPAAQTNILRDIARQVRQRQRVYETWGWREKSARGLGVSALFAGASGTGKTLAAEVLANELKLDLYRIDLSQVVNKYIGETEKNLRRVFDAAEDGGAILLFDEADALFGKRSEIKDSHDRYANIEVSYLLQRMEAYRGLAILTTNMQEALDRAFLRRIRFIVQFAFPDLAARGEIWERIFPTQTPTQGLDVHRLARLNIAGGNIRNIALNAAFLAADADEPVRMAHILRAARAEYAKLDKPLTDAEIRDWVRETARVEA